MVRSSASKAQFLTVLCGIAKGWYSFTPSSGASGGTGHIGPRTHLGHSSSASGTSKKPFLSLWSGFEPS